MRVFSHPTPSSRACIRRAYNWGLWGCSFESRIYTCVYTHAYANIMRVFSHPIPFSRAYKYTHILAASRVVYMHVCIYIYIYVCVYPHVYINVIITYVFWYSIPLSRHSIQIGLFCKRVLYKRQYSAKETYHLIDPTYRSHPITLYRVAKPHRVPYL